MKIVKFGDLKRINSKPSDADQAKALEMTLARNFADNQSLSVVDDIAALIPGENGNEDNLEGQPGPDLEDEDYD